MRFPPQIVASLVVLSLTACAAQEEVAPADGSWVGTITSEGAVTTVVNESGSVWGGTARLEQEASIGVDAGADEYMFGNVTDGFATDELIYVVDAQVSQVRAYDHDGMHRRDVGTRGEGPGEYQQPVMVTIDDAGRVCVYDTRAGVRVFSEDGEALESWSGGLGPGSMVASGRGTVWAPSRFRDPDTGERVYGVGEFGRDGLIGSPRFPSEIPFEPITKTVTTRRRSDAHVAVPFAPPHPRPVVGPFGSIVIGAAHRYRIEIQKTSGSLVAIEKNWVPVPVAQAEADWHRRLLIATLRAEMAPPGWSWDGAEIPAHKPAFASLIAAASGEVWGSEKAKGSAPKIASKSRRNPTTRRHARRLAGVIERCSTCSTNRVAISATSRLPTMSAGCCTSMETWSSPSPRTTPGRSW